jgi:hypothetical protein
MPKKITTTNKVSPKTAVKKVAKKVVAKKPVSVAKKTVTKKASAPKTLVYAENEQSFWVNNGEVLNSLTALYQALASMDEEVFAYHVTKDKNDFSDWVEVVLCDEVCASDLRKAKNPDKACMVVAKHLKKYSA